jgi:hypothetical protein
VLAGLPALPLAGGEAEDFHLHPAALERAREDVGAARGDHDRPAAHGAGIVQKQRNDRVAKGRIALAFEGEW